jgi:hypothetical protein
MVPCPWGLPQPKFKFASGSLFTDGVTRPVRLFIGPVTVLFDPGRVQYLWSGSKTKYGRCPECQLYPTLTVVQGGFGHSGLVSHLLGR